jgi:hypothetical protein
VLASKRLQDGDDRLKLSHYTRFAASERREPERSKPGLQIAQITLAQSQVVDEILHAITRLRACLSDGGAEIALQSEAGFPKFLELGEKIVDFRWRN